MFRSQVALGVCGIAAAGAAVVAAGESVHPGARAAHRAVIAGQPFSYPAVNVAAGLLLALAALGGVVLWILLRGIWTQMRAYRRFVRSIAVLGPLRGRPDVLLIDDAAPQAFCAGYLRPAVYVSRGAVALLAEDELDAVLLHEEQHRTARDPLRFACGRLLSRALFFLPALRPLGDRYLELAEQKADQAAVAASAGERGSLAAALLAFESAAPPGVAGISPERVDSLLGRAPRWRPPQPLIFVSLLALLSVIVLVWRASRAAWADATFNVPVASSQPCMLMLALLPVLVCLAAYGWRRRPARADRARR